MRNRIVSVGGWLTLVFAVTVMAGCSSERVSTQGATAGGTGSDHFRSVAYGTDERDTLRVKTDSARGRHWVLGLNRMRVYDTATRKLIRQIALPSWSVVQFVCMPDLAIDGAGSAFVASNVQPRLWRIDADSFELTEHEIKLQGKEQWDIGFGALAFSANGALYGMMSAGGSVWKIDVAGSSASLVERTHPPLTGCALTSQLLNSFERS